MTKILPALMLAGVEVLFRAERILGAAGPDKPTRAFTVYGLVPTDADQSLRYQLAGTSAPFPFLQRRKLHPDRF